MTDEQLIRITPAPRQIALQEMEFYAFVHFQRKARCHHRVRIITK